MTEVMDLFVVRIEIHTLSMLLSYMVSIWIEDIMYSLSHIRMTEVIIMQ